MTQDDHWVTQDDSWVVQDADLYKVPFLGFSGNSVPLEFIGTVFMKILLFVPYFSFGTMFLNKGKEQ